MVLIFEKKKEMLKDFGYNVIGLTMRFIIKMIMLIQIKPAVQIDINDAI